MTNGAVESRAQGGSENGQAAVTATRLLARARQSLARVRSDLLAGEGEPRLTLIVLTQDRPQHWQRLWRSLREHVRMPLKLLVVDDHSGPAARAELLNLCSEFFAAEDRGAIRELQIEWLAEQLRCPAARRYAVERVTTEYLMFLDDDTEVFPGTLEHLIEELDSSPSVLAAGAHVVLPDGTTQICGGEFWPEPDSILHCEPLGMGLDFEDPAVGASGPCEWVAGAAMAVRRSAFLREPLDTQMVMYYEDNEWCYRVGRRNPPGVFRRSVEALVLHYQELKGPRGTSPEEIDRSLLYLQSIARFYQMHGQILEGVFVFAPRLLAYGGQKGLAARLLLDLISEQGPDRVAQLWKEGRLESLFSPAPDGGDVNGAALAALRRYQIEVATARGERDALHAEIAALATAHTAERAQFEEQREALHRRLETIHASKIWRAADAYWRLRRRVSGRRDDPSSS